jgi:histidine triad (HIT) family protein
MKDDCIFCLLSNGKIPTAKVYENDFCAVILDSGPATKGHALVIPKEHYANITEAPEELVGKCFALAAKLGAAMKDVLGAKGFNVVANTGEAAGQTVMHMHIHVIPRYGDEGVICAWTQHEADADENAKIAEKLAAAMK